MSIVYLISKYKYGHNSGFKNILLFFKYKRKEKKIIFVFIFGIYK